MFLGLEKSHLIILILFFLIFNIWSSLKFIKAKKSLNMNNFIELLLAKNIQIGTYKIKFDQFRDYGTSSKLNLA